uniref:Uncharacterized protein n=1 Tax=Tanacetum cinerariifolium TaxID=118510 RepID=A0A699RDX9_TANCI|nr:hypothetical protein [Tanacetum cinerariifolium]
MKPKAGPMKNSELKTDVMKDKQPVHSTGNNNKGKKVSTQCYIKGYRVNIPKTKLVYRAVVKPQAKNDVACNLEQSSDTTKKPSPSDSSKEGGGGQPLEEDDYDAYEDQFDDYLGLF